MEESKNTQEIRRMRKEQERERRRVRDRERRQSMSQEERERHLARRRRNYQLRRQRAESARLDSQMKLISEGELHIGNDQDLLAASSSPDSSMHFDNALVSLGSDTSRSVCCNRNESLEIRLDDLVKLSGRLRLNHLKHLARTLNKSRVQPRREETMRIAEGDMTATSTRCALSSGLRLSRFKRLARSCNPSAKKISV